MFRDPQHWRSWLARDVDRRRIAEPGTVERVERAVRDFPAMAYAAGLLPEPLPLERVEKLSRGGRGPDGAKVRLRVVAEPGETRGWAAGQGVVITLSGHTARPLLAGTEGPARTDAGDLVRALVVGWEHYPPPVEVEPHPAGDPVALDRFLRQVLESRGR